MPSANPVSVQLVVDSAFGRLGFHLSATKVVRVDLNSVDKLNLPNHPLTNLIVTQLEAYQLNSNKKFNLPFDFNGSDFQCRVWQALTRIPLGKVKSYGELAKELDSSPRAVGNACRRNPLPLLVPCHRVVAKNGLGGFAGATDGKLMTIKETLLRHEGALE
ncbi:methylated-DNA--[protein]-cysteine S-methyltransferase [Aliikangiella sp. IMCC44653]